MTDVFGEESENAVRTITMTFSYNKLIKSKWKVLTIDEVFFYYLARELQMSAIYKRSFIRYQRARKFIFHLFPTTVDLIDYKWNDRVFVMVRERCELDHALSWLSTLGGAFSALGDYFTDCAQTAGRISVNQLKLALRMGDPCIAARCRLYYSLSLIQQGRLRLARRIIHAEYQSAKKAVVVDERLLKMCKGIWAKLQYEHSLKKTRRKIKGKWQCSKL